MGRSFAGAHGVMIADGVEHLCNDRYTECLLKSLLPYPQSEEPCYGHP
jgi:hypothetical protein